MKTNSTQQEILLMTVSSFAQKEWCKKENNENRNLSPEENMEELCANGLIQEVLPEAFSVSNHKLYLWQMHSAASFLQIEFGELPLAIEKTFSLNPHSFLSAFNYN